MKCYYPSLDLIYAFDNIKSYQNQPIRSKDIKQNTILKINQWPYWQNLPIYKFPNNSFRISTLKQSLMKIVQKMLKI